MFDIRDAVRTKTFPVPFWRISLDLGHKPLPFPAIRQNTNPRLEHITHKLLSFDKLSLPTPQQHSSGHKNKAKSFINIHQNPHKMSTKWKSLSPPVVLKQFLVSNVLKPLLGSNTFGWISIFLTSEGILKNIGWYKNIIISFSYL